ncbi:MAG: hypothetical protein ACLFWH_10970, partial [Actinomycetota bacterium]
GRHRLRHPRRSLCPPGSARHALVPRPATFGGFTAAIVAPNFVLLLDERASAPSSCVLAG